MLTAVAIVVPVQVVVSEAGGYAGQVVNERLMLHSLGTYAECQLVLLNLKRRNSLRLIFIVGVRSRLTGRNSCSESPQLISLQSE